MQITFGSPSSEVLSEGIHFRVPLAQKLNLVNVSIQKGEGDVDWLKANFQKLLLGKMSAEEFLDTLADQLNAAQADWKKNH